MTTRNITLTVTPLEGRDSFGKYGHYDLGLYEDEKWVGFAVVTIDGFNFDGSAIDDLTCFEIKPSNRGQGLAEIFIEKLREKFTGLNFEELEMSAEDLIKRYDYSFAGEKLHGDFINWEKKNDKMMQILREHPINA